MPVQYESNYNNFHKSIDMKMSSAKWRPFFLGLDRMGFLVPYIQYITRNMHTVFAFLCFVVVIHWLIFPYPSGLLHWHCGNLTIASVPAKQPWWIWINTSCEFITNDYITTTKQSTTKPCAYFLGYTVRTRPIFVHYLGNCVFINWWLIQLRCGASLHCGWRWHSDWWC